MTSLFSLALGFVEVQRVPIRATVSGPWHGARHGTSDAGRAVRDGTTHGPVAVGVSRRLDRLTEDGSCRPARGGGAHANFLEVRDLPGAPASVQRACAAAVLRHAATRRLVATGHETCRARREQAARDFRARVAAAGGTVFHEALVPEIAYQGALVDVPVATIPELIARRHAALALADDAMFLRPQTVLSAHPEPQAVADGTPPGDQAPVAGLPGEGDRGRPVGRSHPSSSRSRGGHSGRSRGSRDQTYREPPRFLVPNRGSGRPLAGTPRPSRGGRNRLPGRAGGAC